MVRQLMAVCLIALLSGCAAVPAAAPPPGPVSPFFVDTQGLQEGQFYAFRHEGGTIAIRLSPGSSAHVELFDGDDRRLGEFGLNRAGVSSGIQMDDLVPGEYVVRLGSMNGSVGILSGGKAVTFWPLPMHIERTILVQVPRQVLPGIPFIPMDRLDTEVSANLLRAPASLRLLADGSFGWLQLSLRGSAGEVFVAETSGPFFEAFRGDFMEIPARFHRERATEGNLTGHVEVEDLQGSLVLEATSYSRAVPPGQARVGTTPASPSFTYGLLPAIPVAFDVAPTAREIVLWGEPGENASEETAGETHGRVVGTSGWVAIHGPGGARLASVQVPAGAYVTVAVERPGKHVAVLLAGNVTMGADVAPADFALNPLQVHVLEAPERPAGRAGQYATENTTMEVTGILFDVQPAQLRDDVPFTATFSCPPAAIRILQRGETLGAWGPSWHRVGPPVGALLHDGDATLWHDGSGASPCPRAGARLLSFEGPWG